jgi:FtsZ-binding cell division protein ZapB
MDILNILEERIIHTVEKISLLLNENGNLKDDIELLTLENEELKEELAQVHQKKEDNLQEMEALKKERIKFNHEKNEWEAKVSSLVDQLPEIELPSFKTEKKELNPSLFNNTSTNQPSY